jgi:hypothetical protein
MERLFSPSLEGVAEVMNKQLRLAQEKGCDVKVVSTPCSTYRAHVVAENYTHGRLRTI